MWRVIIEKIATLQEIETHWSLDDLVRANDVLDMKNDIENEQMKKVKNDSRNSTRTRN